MHNLPYQPFDQIRYSLSAADVLFADYSASLPTQGSASLELRCSSTALLAETVTAQVNLSTGSSNSYVVRRMQHGSDTLNYNLYTDPTHLQIWGTPPAASGRSVVLVLAVGATLAQALTVYAQAPAGQSPPVGEYRDYITVTAVY